MEALILIALLVFIGVEIYGFYVGGIIVGRNYKIHVEETSDLQAEISQLKHKNEELKRQYDYMYESGGVSDAGFLITSRGVKSISIKAMEAAEFLKKQSFKKKADKK